MTKLGFQLYCARNFPPLSDVLKKVAQAGYTEVEGYGGIYATLDDAGLKAMRADLDANGLTMPTGHFGIDLLEKEPEQALRIAKTLGVQAIYCPHLVADQRPTDAAGWFAFGQRLQSVGKRYWDAGYTFGWHNHDFEFKTLADGSTPQEQILAGARIFPGKRTSPGSSGAAPIRSPGLKATPSGSRPFTSRTLRRPAKTRTRTAGPMSAMAPFRGRT